jgi:hypothetical protein
VWRAGGNLCKAVSETLGPGRRAALLILDGIGWRIVSAAFDLERLITHTR